MGEQNDRRPGMMERAASASAQLVPFGTAMLLADPAHPVLARAAALVTLALYFGLKPATKLDARRAARLARSVAQDATLTLSDYRAIWGDSARVEALRAELNRFLSEYDNALSDEIADALFRVFKHRTREPHDREFVWQMVGLLRSFPATENLNELKRVLETALAFTATAGADELVLHNARKYQSTPENDPYIGITTDGRGHPLTPGNPTIVRRLFRVLKDADFARSTGMTTGAFIGGGSGSPATESDEESLVIGRAVAVKILDVAFHG